MSEPNTTAKRDRRKHLRWCTIEPPPLTPPPKAKAPAIYHIHPASSDKVLVNRANSKYISEALAYRLLKLDSPMKKQYLRQLRCCETLERKGKKFTSNYCGSKTCQQCNRIRTGKLINKYDELCLSLSNPQFITLTCRNINVEDYESRDLFVEAVSDQIDEFSRLFRSMQDYFRKRGIPLKGIRALEVIPSKDGRGVHPHIHWQMDGDIPMSDFIHIWTKNKFDRDHCAWLIKQYRSGGVNMGALKGELIIQLWLKKSGANTDRQGQNARPCDKHSRKELFKYQTKIFSYDKNGAREVKIKLIDMIVQATKGRRAIGITGFLTQEPRYEFEHYFNEKIKTEREAYRAAKIQAATHTQTSEIARLTASIAAIEAKKTDSFKRKVQRMQYISQLKAQIGVHNAKIKKISSKLQIDYSIIDIEIEKMLYDIRHEEKKRDYEIYRSLVKVLEADVNDNLESKELELSDNMAVDRETGELIQSQDVENETFTWSGDNWYSDCIWVGMEQYTHTPRKAVNFKVSHKTRKLVACFNSS